MSSLNLESLTWTEEKVLKTLIKYVGIVQSAMMCAEDATTRPGHFKQSEDGMKFNLLSFLTEGRVRERTSN